MSQVTRFGGAPLAVHIQEFATYVMGQWVGSGSEAAREVAHQAVTELQARRAERLVLDLERLHDVSDAVVSALARSVTDSLRTGRSVCLVRCAGDLYRRMQGAGVAGSVQHAACLLAATHGLAGEPTSIVDLHLRSASAMLARLRHVVSLVAREASLSTQAEWELTAAVNEAASNAIRHGSPEGVKNTVRVSLHLDGGLLIADVADQGPGFDPDSVPEPDATGGQERGLGLQLMRGTMDRVEFYRDERGMLVRMTKRIR